MRKSLRIDRVTCEWFSCACVATMFLTCFWQLHHYTLLKQAVHTFQAVYVFKWLICSSWMIQNVENYSIFENWNIRGHTFSYLIYLNTKNIYLSLLVSRHTRLNTEHLGNKGFNEKSLCSHRCYKKSYKVI